ncbi:hypothetical protein [Rhizobium sp. C4]|uniref:hypothetical protein n=1 Tax=Rhizobium sp. C4 TaxID=1349800 RepID=UPI001E317D93|nr:hypothetical protein [Rhizobium sp. C4]MCD2175355.1 hypothetical protein [Rhizobium sp. C4]
MSKIEISKVIGGKLYNSATATEICTYESGDYTDDFRYELTSLYITTRGRFFLAGEGGALTRWSQPSGNNGSTGGVGLSPLDATEAREFAEQHADADTVAAFFEVEDA